MKKIVVAMYDEEGYTRRDVYKRQVSFMEVFSAKSMDVRILVILAG